MVKVVLRNYNKARGKALFVGYYKTTLRNFVYHNLANKLKELNRVNEDWEMVDEDDFIDIEVNNHLICTMRGIGNSDLSDALYYIDKRVREDK